MIDYVGKPYGFLQRSKSALQAVKDNVLTVQGQQESRAVKVAVQEIKSKEGGGSADYHG